MAHGDEVVREGNRKPVTVAQVEELISRLGGVAATRVVINDWGGVEDIHVLATLERGAKQIVRDVESGLASKFGLMIDRRKISVAQLIGMDPTLPAARLKLARIEASNDLETGLQRVAVTLTADEENGPRYQAERQGPMGHPQSLRLAGEAVLAAVNQSLQPDYLFALEQVEMLTQGPRRLAVVTCQLVSPRPEEDDPLAGAVVSRGDDIDCVVRACLDAVNRRYSMVPKPKRTKPVPAATLDTVLGLPRGTADAAGAKLRAAAEAAAAKAAATQAVGGRAAGAQGRKETAAGKA